MADQIKDQIRISNPKAKKILKKDITKKLLKCFNEKPKTASQIANSISFPKEKIYYHIKNLISLDILFIAETNMVKGIVQKSFLPTAKEFFFDDFDEKESLDVLDKLEIKNISEKIGSSQSKTSFKKGSFIPRNNYERRRNIGRRVLVRRASKSERNGYKQFKNNNDKRKNKDRRIYKDRRSSYDRRISLLRNGDQYSDNTSHKKKNIKIYSYTN